MGRIFFESNMRKKEKQVCAQLIMTDWEFKIIPLNQTTYGIEQVKFEVGRGLSACNTFHGFNVFSENFYLQEFLSLIGKLRYQQRWSRAVRMPQTFVMGHMLVVAILSYFCPWRSARAIKDLKITSFRRFSMDLPEVLTRDIVSPVKSSVSRTELYKRN